MLEDAIEQLAPGDLRAEALSRLAVVRVYNDGFFEGVRLLERALTEVEHNRALRVDMLNMLAYAQINANQAETSLRTVEQAVTEAESLGSPHLLSIALGMRVTLRFLTGHGLDEAGLARALELEDPIRSLSRRWSSGPPSSTHCCWTGRANSRRRTPSCSGSDGAAWTEARRASTSSSHSRSY